MHFQVLPESTPVTINVLKSPILNLHYHIVKDYETHNELTVQAIIIGEALFFKPLLIEGLAYDKSLKQLWHSHHIKQVVWYGEPAMLLIPKKGDGNGNADRSATG